MVQSSRFQDRRTTVVTPDFGTRLNCLVIWGIMNVELRMLNYNVELRMWN